MAIHKARCISGPTPNKHPSGGVTATWVFVDGYTLDTGNNKFWMNGFSGTEKESRMEKLKKGGVYEVFESGRAGANKETIVWDFKMSVAINAEPASNGAPSWSPASTASPASFTFEDLANLMDASLKRSYSSWDSLIEDKLVNDECVQKIAVTLFIKAADLGVRVDTPKTCNNSSSDVGFYERLDRSLVSATPIERLLGAPKVIANQGFADSQVEHLMTKCFRAILERKPEPHQVTGVIEAYRQYQQHVAGQTAKDVELLGQQHWVSTEDIPF